MIGVLLINLGSPASPQTGDVRRYLREFLSDPRVIDIPAFPRWLLVNLIICPFRSPKSAKLYQRIWTPQGSPLLRHTFDLAGALREDLGEEFQVEVAMRYGEPAIVPALERLKEKGVEEIRVLPLYPQYASSSTGSTEDAVLAWTRKQKNLPEVKFLPPFFDQAGFLKSFVDIGAPLLQEFKPDHILFSFHGLPERQIIKGDISGKHCLKTPDCCEKMIPANGMCYRAHCFQSAYGIADLLGLKKDDYTICFQSRLGRTPWIQPFTDIILQKLPGQGKKRVAVFSPSFVADCLETLEEIGMRSKEAFLKDGGQDLLLIPSLNAHPTWVQTVSNMIRG